MLNFQGTNKIKYKKWAFDTLIFIGNIRIVTAKTNVAKGSGSVSASGKGTQTGQKSIVCMQN